MKQIGGDGLEYINKEDIEQQRKLIRGIIKNAGKEILQGKSLSNISLPIKLFDQRGQLER